MEESKQPDFPLLLPLGLMMTAAGNVVQSVMDGVEMSRLTTMEIGSINLERIILNEFVDGISTPERDIFTFPQHEEEVEPEKMVRTLLAELIWELQSRNSEKRTLTRTDARDLRKQPQVANIFKKTALLTDIDVVRLKTVEETTCFLINLTNLMWIHALVFTDEDKQKGLLFKNWPLRHIYLNSIGYIVGTLGFVSLHDLHSVLFGLPSIFRTETLNSLFLPSTDPRIYFLIAQPYAFSPKINVIDPHTLESVLAETQEDYLRTYVVIKDMKLYIPVPVLLYLERRCYDSNPESELSGGPSGILLKQNMLIDMLKSRNLPFEKLLTRDMYIINDTQFKIKFSHSTSDLEEMSTFGETVWRACRVHKSLYQCLEQHVNIVRSTMLEDHYSEFSCQCISKSSELMCYNNNLLRMGKIFQPLFRQFGSETDYLNKGLRCLYASLAFTVGAAKYSELEENADDVEEASRIYQLAETVFMKYSTSLICEKMKMCLRVILSENELYMKWPHWYDLFFGDPNDVLSEIVTRENAALACEWVAVQIKYEPDFHFSAEPRSKFLSLLSGLEDTSYLRQAFEYTDDIPIADIIDCLIESACPVSKLIRLVTTVLDINNLNNTETIKFNSLLLGLKMISCVAKNEQSYYYSIVYKPLLIVEQLILNKKIATLKEVLNEVTPFMVSLPEMLQQVETISRNEIDELLKSFADKALHFRRKTSSGHRRNAALLHAFIFKDGDNFHPPDRIPAEDDWIPNDMALVCLCCQKEFSVFTRRHHCRRCGRVVCNACSSRKLKLTSFDSPQRVCEQCFKFESEYLSEESANENLSVSGEEKGKKPTWILSTDQALNDYVRNQAAFETAPDIELCLSLLELHTESISVPRFLFAHAESMLKILRQRLVCPANFDYPEVTHIVKSLLLAAKVYYTHLGDVQGARRCEELTNETDMLNQLAKFKFAPLEPGKPIRDVQDWKQIRNVLLEQQNWELALELSTKNGLECGSIWYLWGMHLLKAADWPSARDRFCRSNLKKNPKMLTTVLDIIYSSPDKEAPRIFSKFFQSSNVKKAALPEKVYEECLYYLKNYGSGDQLFDFYVQNDRVFDAVHVVFSKKIATKKFLHKIYVPYLKNGDQTKILKYMASVDRTLVGWKDYIHEICVHCSGNKHFEALYETQLWIKDYYRAAISCTLFYKMQTKCYTDLTKNNEHLQNAISHFETAASRLINKENTELEQVIDPKKIEIYINTVNLQLEASKLVCRNSIYANRQFETVPTLFGGENEKFDVMFLVFDASEDKSEAFSCLDSIMKTWSMNMSTVLNKVATKLMEENKEDSVAELIACVKKGVSEPEEIVDSIARVAIVAKAQKPDVFLQSITDKNLKFDMYIEAGKLKTAYLLAVTMKRKDYVERVYYEAKRLNKAPIEKICMKHLGLVTEQT